MWARGVAIHSPNGEHRSGVGKRGEERFVEALAPEAPDGKGGLAGSDVVSVDLTVLQPLHDRCAGELGTVVGYARGGSPTPSYDGNQARVQHARPRAR